MTTSPGPRVFDLSYAPPVDAPMLPALDRTFWHGTQIQHLEEILRTGLIPERSLVGHTCLSTDPAVALFFGRLVQSLDEEKTGGEGGEGLAPVLLKIHGSLLDPEAICPESGCAIGAHYGMNIPQCSADVLHTLANDSIALMDAVGALGYLRTLSITADMVDARPRALPTLPMDDAILEGASGTPMQPETLRYLALLAAEEASLPATA